MKIILYLLALVMLMGCKEKMQYAYVERGYSHGDVKLFGNELKFYNATGGPHWIPLKTPISAHQKKVK